MSLMCGCFWFCLIRQRRVSVWPYAGILRSYPTDRPELLLVEWIFLPGNSFPQAVRRSVTPAIQPLQTAMPVAFGHFLVCFRYIIKSNHFIFSLFYVRRGIVRAPLRLDDVRFSHGLSVSYPSVSTSGEGPSQSATVGDRPAPGLVDVGVPIPPAVPQKRPARDRVTATPQSGICRIG